MGVSTQGYASRRARTPAPRRGVRTLRQKIQIPFAGILWARVPKGMLREGLEPLHPAGVSGPYGRK